MVALESWWSYNHGGLISVVALYMVSYIHGGLMSMVALQPWWPFALYLCACRPKGISCFGLESAGEMAQEPDPKCKGSSQSGTQRGWRDE